MIQLLEKLIGLFKLVDIDLPKLEHIHIFSDNKSEKIVINGPIININLVQLSKQEITVLGPYIYEYFKQEEVLLIEKHAEQIIVDFKNSMSSTQNHDLVTFFTGKIPSTDLEILRASLFIKEQYDKGIHIDNLKDDIIYRYGNRGRNIVNLCTAGYFSTILKPLYEDMSSESDFKIEKWNLLYDFFISKAPLAIFVNNFMSEDELIRIVEEKMTFNSTYGINYLNIHGIGSENLFKIEKLILHIKSRLKGQKIESTRNYAIVTIYF